MKKKRAFAFETRVREGVYFGSSFFFFGLLLFYMFCLKIEMRKGKPIANDVTHLVLDFLGL